VKKPALYTAAGVDHDFNFLTSMVSKISREEKSAVQPPGATTAKWRRKRGDVFWARAKDMGLIVHRAPFGLSREKENRSRYIGKYVNVLSLFVNS
jgi:hypothetical protein